AATFALETIAETGRAALADMRRLLGVLREDDGEPGDDGALAPQPGSGDLETLVEQVRASGLNVSLVRMGTPRALPPGVGLTAYRICQEALTNVMKHAGPDPSVTLLVQWTDTSLSLEISDDGRGAAADLSDEDAVGGHGLLGMRERAMMLGGTLTVGPRPGGGFRVRATLPLPPPAGSGRAPAAGSGSVPRCCCPHLEVPRDPHRPRRRPEARARGLPHGDRLPARPRGRDRVRRRPGRARRDPARRARGRGRRRP